MLAKVCVDKLETVKRLPGDDVGTGASVRALSWSEALFAFTFNASAFGTFAFRPLVVDFFELSLAVNCDFTAAISAADAFSF